MGANSLLRLIGYALDWLKSLIVSLLKIVFFETVVIFLFTFISQVLVIISAVMPLKIVMLLGSDKIPIFFPNTWQSVDKDLLIIYLAIASIVFFIGHLISEKIIVLYSNKGSGKILENNNKLILFENQNKLTQTTYKKLVKSLADMFFSIISMIILGIVYPLLFLMLIFFMLSVYIFFSVIYGENKSAKLLNEDLNSLLNLINDIGFFVVFAFILSTFLLDFYPPKIIIVIISVLLVRKIFAKMSGSIGVFIKLYRNRVNSDSLFFFNNRRAPIVNAKKDLLWSFLNQDIRDEWIERLVINVLGNNITYIDSQWLNVNIKNIAFIKVNTRHRNVNKINTYLIKIYNKNISSQAIHEKTLLQQNIHGLFNLPFIGLHVVHGFNCNMFDFNNSNPILEKDFNMVTPKIRLMSIKIPKDLLKKFSRSYPLLCSRLSKEVFDKLYLVSSYTEVSLIQKFEDNFDFILKRIKLLPLQIINPNMTQFSLMQSNDDFVSLHWGGWKIDSLGVDFPISANSINALEGRFNLVNIKIDDIILASLMSRFETLYIGENFSKIIEIIPKILNCVKCEK